MSGAVARPYTRPAGIIRALEPTDLDPERLPLGDSNLEQFCDPAKAAHLGLLEN